MTGRAAAPPKVLRALTRGTRRVVALTCLALVAATSTAACSGSSHGADNSASSAPAGPSAAAEIRWWSNSATTAGSRIDSSKSDPVSRKLRPSRADYCGMLRQTVSAGKAIFGSSSTADPAWVGTLTAFLEELERVAPSEVSADWQLLGNAMIKLVQGGGKAPLAGAASSAPSIEQAAGRVAADAKSVCDVDLSHPAS